MKKLLSNLVSLILDKSSSLLPKAWLLAFNGSSASASNPQIRSPFKDSSLLLHKNLSYILLFFLITNSAQAIEYTHCFAIDDTKVFLEVAKDKTKGLMGRDTLLPNTGMVFFYPSYEDESFWMKNTKIPLDIIFMKDGTVTKVYKNVQPCVSDICKTYPSKGVVNQVLEVNAGFCKLHKIKKGSTIWVQELR